MNSIEILVTEVFEKSLKHLAKRFPSFKNTYQKVINDLRTTPNIGDEIKGHQSFYKVRYPNPDARKGKSGGFRVIYLWDKEKNLIVLVDIYSKTDRGDVDWDLVSKAMEEIEYGGS